VKIEIVFGAGSPIYSKESTKIDHFVCECDEVGGFWIDKIELCGLSLL